MATDGNGQNGNGNGHGDALKLQVDAQREVVRRTAAELEDRLRDKTHEVREKIEHARDKVTETVSDVKEKLHVVGDKMDDVTGFVQRHRYAVLGGSLAAGVVLGMRRQRRERRQAQQAIRYVVQEPAKKATLLGSLAGALFAFAAKQGVSYLTERLHGGSGDDDRDDGMPGRFTLPSAGRRPFVE